MDDGFKYLEAKGDSTESSYAYTGKTGTCNSQKQSAADGIKKGAVSSYHDVTTEDEAQILAAVAQQPVSVAIEADQSGFQFYKSGVFSGTCGTNLDHGVLVVGYGTDSGKDYWKVKNSWGATWGQAGYIMLARGNSTASNGRKLLGGGGGNDECGILKQPSYPTIKKTVLTAEEKSLNDLWAAWKAQYKKGYTGAEHDAAFETFKANVAFIHEHNKDAEKHGFTVALNQF